MRDLIPIIRAAFSAHTLISAIAMGGFVVALTHCLVILEAIQ